MASPSPIILAVGSTNPVKAAAARNGAIKLFQHDNVTSENYNVPSMVSDQPMSDKETLTGAMNRARLAYEAYQTAHDGVGPTYAVGLEGGVRDDSEGVFLECFAWIVVYNGHFYSKSSTASFLLPLALKKMIVEDKMELGHADDILFKRENSKQNSGSVGLFTHNAIDRTAYYEHAVTLAFAPFVWPDLYPLTPVVNASST